MLQQRLAALPSRPMPGEDGYARVALGEWLATRLVGSGDFSGARALVERLRSDPGVVPALRLNADVNAALIAARAGQARAALVLIAAALTRFRGQPEGEDYAPDRATLREPVLIAAMKGKARLLPPVFRAAVSGWRAGALDVGVPRR